MVAHPNPWSSASFYLPSQSLADSERPSLPCQRFYFELRFLATVRMRVGASLHHRVVRCCHANARLGLARLGIGHLVIGPTLCGRRRTLATEPTPGARTLDAPFISDTMPLAEGIIGELGEILVDVGATVEENDVVAVIETEKAAINVKVLRTHQIMSHTCHLPRPDFQPSPRVTMCQANCSGVIGAVLVELDEEIKEEMPMFELQ